MKEQIQKDKRVNSRFLTALLVAEAALRPIANDWALIHKFSTDNSVGEVVNKINEIRRMNL
jgi:hypothetical protein